MSGQFVKDLPLEVFGFWQVEDYVPPPAENGKVPRNEYGNVELYKRCMLPKGTVHLQRKFQYSIWSCHNCPIGKQNHGIND
jgi:xeroderma pigmentosum group C-complementing protein